MPTSRDWVGSNKVFVGASAVAELILCLWDQHLIWAQVLIPAARFPSSSQLGFLSSLTGSHPPWTVSFSLLALCLLPGTRPVLLSIMRPSLQTPVLAQCTCWNDGVPGLGPFVPQQQNTGQGVEASVLFSPPPAQLPVQIHPGQVTLEC